MLIVIVTFKLDGLATLAEMTKRFHTTAPKYRNVPGLLRKNYIVSQDTRIAGGVYLWESREAADRMYTPDFKQFIRDTYQCEPEIRYFESPVMVDNVAQTVIEGGLVP